MKILRYIDFTNEELVYGFKKKLFDEKTAVCFKDIFNNDPLSLKSFIQSVLPNQNLKYLGAGCQGLAFQWVNPKPLSQDFLKKDYFGYTPDSNKELVLKFTANLGEKEGSKKLIELTNSKDIKEFLKYYWIKEVDLPESNVWSRTLGPQLPWQKTKYPISDREDIKTRMGDMLQYNSEEDIKRFVDTKRKAGTVKIERAYIVCLEKLTRTLNEQEKCVIEVLLLWMKNPTTTNFQKGPLDFELPNEEKIKDIYKFVMFDDEEIIPDYTEDEVGIGLELKKRFREQNISNDFFIDFTKKVCEVYTSGLKNKIPINDIHGDNLGYRGEELVAFDCM